jgi:hypothetical protein
VGVSVRRTVPVIGSVGKEDGRRSELSYKRVILTAAINFVLRISECEGYDLKFIDSSSATLSCA